MPNGNIRYSDYIWAENHLQWELIITTAMTVDYECLCCFWGFVWIDNSDDEFWNLFTCQTSEIILQDDQWEVNFIFPEPLYVICC